MSNQTTQYLALSDLRAKIEEYKALYRKPGLCPIVEAENVCSPVGEEWATLVLPKGEYPGVYALMHNPQGNTDDNKLLVLYIGSSKSDMNYRFVHDAKSHFKKDDTGKTRINKATGWWNLPLCFADETLDARITTWATPYHFEAVALESFVIRGLNPVNNTNDKSPTNPMISCVNVSRQHGEALDTAECSNRYCTNNLYSKNPK